MFPDEQNEGELIVIWSSENRDIVDVHITLESNGRNLTPINPDWDKKWASITVPDNNVSLVITVTEENKCGQKFSSEGYQTRTCKTTDFHLHPLLRAQLNPLEVPLSMQHLS